MKLADALERCYRGDEGGVDTDAAHQWALMMHAAFYVPVPRGVSASGGSGNKFLELEIALTQVFTKLAQQESTSLSAGVSAGVEHDLWAFAVRVVLLLAIEPMAVQAKATSEKAIDQSMPKQDITAAPREPTSQRELPATSTAAAAAPVVVPAVIAIATTSERRPKSKKTKTAQPFAPLAFVVVNALKKLADVAAAGGGSASIATRFCELGKHDAALVAFCQQGLTHPDRVDSKLLVEIIDLFQIEHVAPSLVLAAGERFVASKSNAAAIKLCGMFCALPWPYERMVRTMAQGKDWVSAELLVRSASGVSDDAELSKALVDEAIALHDLKRAHRFVHTFSLQHAFPDIESMYSRDGLLKLITKHKWQLALTFVGNDSALQRILFDHAVAAGEIAHAVHLANCLGLVDYRPDASQIADRSGGTRGTTGGDCSSQFVQLPLESNTVLFCDDEQHIRAAHAFFFGATRCDAHRTALHHDCIVGLDVEWKPTSSRFTTRTTASILQIATMTRVFIVDLLMLHDNDFLFEHFLPLLFSSQTLLKVGFGFDSDMRVLHQTFPERSVFLQVSPFLELSTAIARCHGAGAGKSLSSAAALVLGKPLDKRMQLSNWEARPLSASQLQYAAVDAFCLVAILLKMTHLEASPEQRDEAASGHACNTVREQITMLKTAAAVNAETCAELTQLRQEYVADWHAQRVQMSSTPHSSELLTPDDVLQFWDAQQVAYLAALENQNTEATTPPAESDLTIKFLSAKTANELLASHATEPHKARKFMHINSICFFADSEPCVVCIDASARLDTAALARFCGVGRRKLKLATPAECASVFGFLPGTVPPFGHRPRRSEGSTEVDGDGGDGVTTSSAAIKVFADAALMSATYFLSGGGSPDAFLWMPTSAFFHVLEVQCATSISIGVSSTSSSSDDAVHASATGASASAPVPLSSERATAASELKFVADTMASQVARWLRTIGVDVVTWDAAQHSSKSDSSQSHRAKLIAFAAKERRIILTRDTQLAARRDAGACLVLSSDVCYKQFREVKTHFGLYARKDGSASRCARCNATEFVSVDLAFARSRLSERVLAKVLASPRAFWMCTACERIYWDGPKYTTSSGADGEVMYQPQVRQRRTRKPVAAAIATDGH